MILQDKGYILIYKKECLERQDEGMCEIWLVIFLISVFVHIGIMLHDPRTLWSGFSFFWMLTCLAFFCSLQYLNIQSSFCHMIGILIVLFVITVSCVLAFPGLLIVMFFVEGIKVIRHEGIKPSNLLSMLFSLLLYAYLAIWPKVGDVNVFFFGCP